MFSDLVSWNMYLIILIWIFFCVGFRGYWFLQKRVKAIAISLYFFLPLVLSLSLFLFQQTLVEKKRDGHGENGSQGWWPAHVSILTTFSLSILSLQEFFFQLWHLPSTFSLSLAVCQISSATPDRLTRGKERKEGKEIFVFPVQLYAPFYL